MHNIGGEEEMKSEKSRAKIGIIAFVFLLASLAFAGSASAKTIYVPTDYPTIQEAIDAASSGDIVFVYNGTYYEDGGVSISKNNITLQGEDANTTIIHGMWTAEKVVYVTGDYVNVSDFTVAGSTASGYGIYVTGDNCIITDNNIVESCYGIYLYDSDNSTVAYNNASEREYGIYLSSSSNNTIANNIANSNQYGIYLDSSGNCVLKNNIANSNDYDGISLSSSSNCVLKNNIANSNGWAGIHLSSSSNCVLDNNIADSNDDYGISLFHSSNCVLKNNIANSSDYGIYLYSSSGCNITANIVDTNIYGICLRSTSTNNNITENNIVNNTVYGMYLDYSGDNEIYHNNFINNNKQAYDHHGFNKWDKGPVIGGNYWSDHVCHGNPSNGTEPYTKIDTDVGAVDHYPFEDPDGWVIPPPPLPDLVISPDNISFSPESPYEGEIVKINATVHNIGTKNASNITVRFFDGANPIGSDQVIDFIAVGEQETVSITWTGAAGTHVITVKVDPENEIEESCETNNEASKSITVKEQITEIEVKTDKETYSPGDTMNVKICIKNLGQARDVRFGCWLTIPKLGYATVLAYKPMTLPADYDDCFGSSIPIGNWGASGFAGIWGVGLFEPDTGEVIDCDIATWNYKPSVTEQKKMPAEITKEITKEIESVKLPA